MAGWPAIAAAKYMGGASLDPAWIRDLDLERSLDPVWIRDLDLGRCFPGSCLDP